MMYNINVKKYLEYSIKILGLLLGDKNERTLLIILILIMIITTGGVNHL